MPALQSLDYATPNPRPSRLWIICRIVLALPMGGIAVGGILAACLLMVRGDPVVSVAVFLYAMGCVALTVIVFRLPIDRPKDDADRI